MNREHWRVWIPLFLFLILVGVVHIPLRAAAQEAHVNPSSGPPDTEFFFSARGFIAREWVNYWLTLPDGTAQGNVKDYEVRADDNGNAQWMWRAPRNAQPGIWLMVARGRETQLEHAIRFEVTPGSPTDEHEVLANVAPSLGPPGTDFAFFARGFRGDEEVGFWLNTPDGGIVSRSFYRTTAHEGRADWTWKAPDDAQPGIWQMVARGATSTRERVIPFEIR